MKQKIEYIGTFFIKQYNINMEKKSVAFTDRSWAKWM